LLHLLLLVLAVLLTWETAKALLPFSLPSLAHSVLVVALAYAATFVPDAVLTVAATASAVGILHHVVGSTDSRKPPLAFPRRKSASTRASRVPDLP